MGHSCETGASHAQDRRALLIALGLNAVMFVVDMLAGVLSGSTSLLADAADFFSDSISYIITLYVLTRPLHVRARASLLKASFMLVLAAGALAQGVYNVSTGHIPGYMAMGIVSVFALMANLASAYVLYGSRGRDSNMRSVWLCSRNDALANIMIMIAAGLVYATGTLWPDLAAALVITVLEGSSALKIIAHAKEELRTAP
jgi:Co/Zn/Cd efflux system component